MIVKVFFGYFQICRINKCYIKTKDETKVFFSSTHHTSLIDAFIVASNVFVHIKIFLQYLSIVSQISGTLQDIFRKKLPLYDWIKKFVLAFIKPILKLADWIFMLIFQSK